MKKCILPMIILLGMASCQQQQAAQENAHEKVAIINVPYQEAQRYFVKNNFQEGKSEKILKNQKDFEEIFGAAAVMGKEGIPTKVDFTKSFVVAVIAPTSSNENEIKIESLQDNGKELKLNYTIVEGKDQGFSTRNTKILILDKKSDKPVVFQEVK
ncbi:hypothetical protein [Elizabethkingia sp. JS20170427COW]|uniref:hypothetical protein n=1 Tax=Elizabethkingia sp. JS20170427COW TaxID=2583851 RepID=UPI001110ABF2|nr:hypothetical protein [Elizabethkingia sp. JS20170427COW]QCX53767.1 hypothetical protein FGE20_08505 [Elizabethkingia sp. JS20170427COW]